jgi:hypothetical protein
MPGRANGRGASDPARSNPADKARDAVTAAARTP